MQRDVGVHMTTDPTDGHPGKILESISPQARQEMAGLVKSLLSDVIVFARAIQAPLRDLMNEQVPTYASWTPEMLSEFTAGYILAFNNTKFQALTTKAVVEVSNAIGDLGAKMGGVGMDLTRNLKGVANTQDIKNLMQLSVQQMAQVMTTSSGHVFNGMWHFLNGLPTEYMRTATTSLKSMVRDHTSGAMNDYYKLKLAPTIKSTFEDGDLCDDLQDKLSGFGNTVEAVRDDAADAIAGMNRTITALEPYIIDLDHDLVPQAVASVRHSLEQLGGGLDTMGLGFDMYRKALLKALEEKLSCPKQE